MPVILIVVVIIVVVLMFAVKAGQETTAAWKTFADAHGLQFHDGGLYGTRRMEGPLRGFSVRIEEFSKGSGNSRSRHTRILVAWEPSLGMGLKLTREHAFSGFMKMFGAQDAQVGDPQFDEEVIVGVRDFDRMQEWLTPSRRAKIRRFFHLDGAERITDEAVVRENRGLVRDRNVMAQRLAPMLVLARSLTRDDVDPVDTIAAAQESGRLDEAEELLAVRPEAPPEAPADEPVDLDAATAAQEDVDSELLRGQLHLLAGREDLARKSFLAAGMAAPDDPEVRGWVETVEETDAEGPDDAPVAEAEAAESTEPAPPGSAPSSNDDLVDTLFAPDVLSFEAQRRFEEHYKDCPAHVFGTLEEIAPFTFDLVFGNTPGRRARIVIGESASSRFASKAIYVLAALPAEDDGSLSVGDRVEVRGTFAKIDAFMRNLYVVEATVRSSPS